MKKMSNTIYKNDILKRFAVIVAIVLSSMGASATKPTVTNACPSGEPCGTHGFPMTSTPDNLVGNGYVEQEFFVAGTANSYTSSSPLTANGIWNSVSLSGSSAAYKTRILVRRPAQARRFNGTVIVEFLHDSGYTDSDQSWILGATEIMRSGSAWVGVTTLREGVFGSGPVPPLGFIANSLTAWDPVRYGSLTHPGNDFSYDIFSQAGQALRNPGRVDPLGGLKVKRLIATGTSSSADPLVIYYNAIQPLQHVFNGFLVNEYNAFAIPVALSAADNIFPPGGTLVRSDSAPQAPVLAIHSESEVMTDNPLLFPYALNPQGDSTSYRGWEVAGTAHIDQTHFLRHEATLVKSGLPGFSPACSATPNDIPLQYVGAAGIFQLNKWITTGIPAPAASMISRSATGTVFRDSFGNAVEGVRTPFVDVPVASYSGAWNFPSGPFPDAFFCFFFGTKTSLPQSTLSSLYPSHTDYVLKVAAATLKGVLRGFILPADGVQIVEDAANSNVGQ